MDTTHSFVPSKLNQTLCAVCYRTSDLHSIKQDDGSIKHPTCEACPNTNELKNVNGIWLCPDCFSKELENPSSVKVTISPPETFQSITEKLVSDHRPNDMEHTALNALGTQAISKSEQFFNARTKAINDRWLEIVADESITTEQKHYTLAKEVREHFIHLKNVLFQVMEVQLEGVSEQRADQIYLNQLASKLREEERVKLHLQNMDYVPPAIPKSAPKVAKVSKDDRIAADYARIMNIPIETARRLLNNKLKEVVGPCTCAETPGICALHNNK